MQQIPQHYGKYIVHNPQHHYHGVDYSKKWYTPFILPTIVLGIIGFAVYQEVKKG